MAANPRPSGRRRLCISYAPGRLIAKIGCALLLAFSIMRGEPPDPQARGDFRSTRSGPWASTQTWEKYDSAGWVAADKCPDSSSGLVSVRAGHVVTILSSLVYDQVVVERDAQVVVVPGVSHTLNDGRGVDLTIEGTWVNQGSSWTIVGSARWAVNDGGVYVHNTTTGIATPLSKSMLSKFSTFIYRGGPSLVPASTFSGRTYGHLRFESSGGSCTLSATGTGALAILGDLTIGSGVKWNTGGFSGAITVQGSTSIAGEWGGAGSGSLGVHTFEGPFKLESGGRYTLASTGGSQGSMIFDGDVNCASAFTAPAGRVVEFNGSSVQTIFTPAGMLLSNGAVTGGELVIATGSTVEIASQKSLTLRRNCDCSGTIVGRDSTSCVLVSDSCHVFVNNGSVLASVRIDSTVSDRMISGEGVWKEILVDRGTALRVSGSHSLLGRGAPFSVLGTAVFEPGSVISYRGELIQGVSPQLYSDLTVDNPEGVRLMGTTIVNGRLAVKRGVIVTSTHSLKLGSQGSIEELGSNKVVGALTSTRRPGAGKYEDFGGIGVGIKLERTSDKDVVVTRRTDTCWVISRARSVRRSFTFVSTADLRIATILFRFDPLELHGASESALELYGSADGGAKWSRLGGAVDTLTHSLSFAGIRSEWLITLAEPFQQPRIDNVTPSFAEQGSQAELIVSGFGFKEGLSDLFVSGIGVKVNSVSVESNTRLFVNISIDANAPLGMRDIHLETAGGETQKTSALEIVAAQNPVPQIHSIAPSTGVRLEPLALTFHGSGFIEGVTSVSLGDGIAGTVYVVDPTLLVVDAVIDETASLGPRSFSVVNAAPGGGIATLAQAFSVVNPVPRIASISPRKAARGDCPEISVTGANFISGVTTLDFGSGIVLESLRVVSPTLMQARIRIEFSVARCTRTAVVTNRDPGGGRGTLTEGLQVTDPPPRVLSISCPILARGSRRLIDFIGSGFVSSGLILSLGAGIVVDSVCIVDSCRMRASIFASPSALPGPRDIILANVGPDGESSILSRALVVSNPPPLVTRIDPSSAALGQTLNVTLTGSALFPDATALDLGSGIKINSYTPDSTGARLTASISVSFGAEVGQKDVRVTNSAPGGGEVVLPLAFAVVNPVPSIAAIRPASGGKGRTMEIDLSGLNFVKGVTRVSLSPGVSTDSSEVLSPSLLRARISISPTAVVGARTVVVTNAPPGGGVTRLMHVFNVENALPEIYRVEPEVIWRGECVTLSVHGSGFSAGITNVDLGSGLAIESTKVASPSLLELTLSVPVSTEPGARDVRVSNLGPGGGEALLRNAFVVHNPPPQIESITPHSGGTGKSLSVTLTGRGFLQGVTTVELGEGIMVDSLAVKSTRVMDVRILIPPITPSGPRCVTVSNPGPGGGTALLRDGFSVVAPLPSTAELRGSNVPDQPILVGAYPNPFNNAVTVKYGLSAHGRVRIAVRNILGVEIAVVVNEVQIAGYHTVLWASSREPSGVYFLHLVVESDVPRKRFTASMKLILLK